jgi:hypothetical protein
MCKNIPGIFLVYSWHMTKKTRKKICHAYARYMPFGEKVICPEYPNDIFGKSYVRDIPGICHLYHHVCHMDGIFHVYS